MRVMIDARKSGFGITRYCENLISGLARIDRDNQYVMIQNSNDRQKTMEVDNFKTVYVSYPRFSTKTLLFLHKVIHRERIDVFHSPSIMFPLFAKCPVVLTVHDLIPLRFYRGHSRHRLLPFWIIKLIIFTALKKADQIITVSQFTRNEILNFAPFFRKRINVIYNSLSNTFKKTSAKDGIQSVEREFSWPRRMILYAGSMKPHKNIDRLLKAFNQLKQKGEVEDVCMVLGGGEKENITRLKKLALELGIDGNVIFTGMLSAEELTGLMNLADVFVFPSLYEGFGLPPLEAMACGTPVVTSNAGSLPEVVGDAALLVDPENVEDIASAIERVLTDERLREELVKKGFERVKRFSWEKTARETIEIYKSVAGTKG
jgi:glycosyltransferase involved in cell wall biosynthesis